MHVKIKNWRCIKELEFDLSKINVFLGQNATGKSSLAYALYAFSEIIDHANDIFIPHRTIIDNLYGVSIDEIVRKERNYETYYPIEIICNESYVILTEDECKLKGKHLSLWKEQYLLPSIRTSCLQILKALQEKKDKRIKIEDIPLPPPAKTFFSDLKRAINKPIIIKGDKYIMTIKLLMTQHEFEVEDPYIGIILPLKLAPDGQLDFSLIDFILSRASERSLIIIEEPEIYKNPLLQFKLMENISEYAIEKDLTVVMTTHSEIIPLSIAKFVESEKISKDDVKIYYLMRSKENPWTEIKEIKVYDDGTLEELPDSEKITAYLF